MLFQQVYIAWTFHFKIAFFFCKKICCRLKKKETIVFTTKKWSQSRKRCVISSIPQRLNKKASTKIGPVTLLAKKITSVTPPCTGGNEGFNTQKKTSFHRRLQVTAGNHWYWKASLLEKTSPEIFVVTSVTLIKSGAADGKKCLGCWWVMVVFHSGWTKTLRTSRSHVLEILNKNCHREKWMCWRAQCWWLSFKHIFG